ncbi:MAG: two pore domain potassium channel family protein [Candidatus Latescibacteria bacterium]|jgi:hypothetical protein|nr:two pore domain potassium channel family protein [Candidatus Latescibacterota bacterium]
MQDHVRSEFRFTQLLVATVLLMIGYPYFSDDSVGAFLGGMSSLIICCAGVYAVHTTRWRFAAAIVFALFAAGSLTVIDFVQGVRGHPLVEFSFFLFYSFITLAVFLEVIQTIDIKRDTIFGTVAVYLLVGLTFGTLYDFVETISPGSFHAHVVFAGVDGGLGFRQLLYFSFMTLTTVGYGDITAVTAPAQSVVAIEGVIGVLYVAVLVARIVGIYSAKRESDF